MRERLADGRAWVEALASRMQRAFLLVVICVTARHAFGDFLLRQGGFPGDGEQRFLGELLIAAVKFLAGWAFLQGLRGGPGRGEGDGEGKREENAACGGGEREERTRLRRVVLLSRFLAPHVVAFFLALAFAGSFVRGGDVFEIFAVAAGSCLFAQGLARLFALRLSPRARRLLGEAAGFVWSVGFAATLLLVWSWPASFLLGDGGLEDLAGRPGWRIWRAAADGPGGAWALAFLGRLLASSWAATAFLVVAGAVALGAWSRKGASRRADGSNDPPAGERIAAMPRRSWLRRLERCGWLGLACGLLWNGAARTGRVGDRLWWVELCVAALLVVLLSHRVTGRIVKTRWRDRLRHVVTGDGEAYLWRCYGLATATVLAVILVVLAIAALAGHLAPRQLVFAFFTLFQTAFVSVGLALWFRFGSLLGGRPDRAVGGLSNAAGQVYLAAGFFYLLPVLATDALLVKAMEHAGTTMRLMGAWFALKVIYAFAGLFFAVVLPMDDLEGRLHPAATASVGTA